MKLHLIIRFPSQNVSVQYAAQECLWPYVSYLFFFFQTTEARELFDSNNLEKGPTWENGAVNWKRMIPMTTTLRVSLGKRRDRTLLRAREKGL